MEKPEKKWTTGVNPVKQDYKLVRDNKTGAYFPVSDLSTATAQLKEGGDVLQQQQENDHSYKGFRR